MSRFTLLFSLIVVLAAPLAAQDKVILQQSGDEPHRRITIENPYLRLVINASQGGRIESLVHTTSKHELTLPLGETVPGGLLSDQIWQQNFWHGDWAHAPYEVKVLEQTPEMVKVELDSPAGVHWTGLTFQKVLTVWRDRSVIQVDYTMRSDTNANPRTRPDFHFHQGLAGHGKVFLPAESGILERPISAEPESWVFEPSRGWLAYVQDGGAGLGATFDFKRLQAFRASQEPIATMEWIFRKADFKPGSSETTPVRLAAFAGLNEVAAVGERCAAEIHVGAPANGQAQLHLAFAPFEDFAGRLSVYVRPLKEKTATLGFAQNITFKVDKVTNVEQSIKLPGAGNWVVQGVLQSEGMRNIAFEQPVIVGGGAGTYAMLPQEERIPEQSDMPSSYRFKPIDLQFNSLGIPTPHRDWARKWAGGRPRVLALLPEGDDREAVEMMQRFDMDITTAYLCKDTYYVLGDSVLGLKLDTVHKNLMETLEKDYEVIVVSVYNAWGLLPAKARAKILEKVDAGTGLVVPMRGGPPDDLKDYYPLNFFGYDHATGQYTLDKNAPPIINALPYEAMPYSYYSNGSTMRQKPSGKPMGQVLLRAVMNGADRGPLIAITERETERDEPTRLVFAQTEGALVPYYTKFQPSILPDQQLPAFDYWEYHYAMMARLIYWAARKESPVTLLTIEGTQSEAKVAVDSKITGAAQAQLTVRDKFGQVLETRTQPFQLKEGEQSISLPVTTGARGAYLADVILSNEQGVLAFGAGTFPKNPTTVAKLEAKQPVYGATEQAVWTADIKGDVPAGAMVHAEVWDGADRQVASLDVPAAASTQIALPLQRVIGTRYQLRTTLIANGRVLDQAAAEGRIRGQRDTNRYYAYFWGGVGGGTTENIIRETYKLYKRMGINANLAGEGDMAYDARFLQWLNIPYSSTAMSMYTVGGVTKADASKKPVEMGNASTNPKAPAEYFAKAAEIGKKRRDDGVLLYYNGDENRGSGKDVDFSENGKRGLREWLQKYNYKTISDLNREWGTDYKSFDEVIAMSEDETRANLKTAKTIAPWLDQRRYMVWAAAQLGKSINDGIRSTDPGAIVGESGTQEPYVYGTDRDWWLMSRAYTGLGAYGGEQTVQQESYNPNLIRYTWAGYGKPAPLNRVSFYNILGRFDKGIAIFAARSHIDPDFTLPECGRNVQGILAELKRGIGQMMVSAKVQYQPVYVLQSPSSMYGAYMMGNDKLNKGSSGTTIALLRDLGIQYKYISYEQLANGELATNGAKVLILPMTVALSHAEMDGLRNWVKTGGTVMADLQTGLMTDHGRLFPKPQLGDVFGIDREKVELKAAGKDQTWTVKGSTGEPALQFSKVEIGITGTAKPLLRADGPDGALPLLYHNTFGKGHAYYWGADIMGAYDAANGNTDDANSPARIQYIQLQFDRILQEAGVAAPLNVRLRDPQTGALGPHSPWLYTSYKKAGDVRFYTVFRNYAVMQSQLPDVPVTVQFKEPGMIYDVVAGRWLGQGDSVDMSLDNYTGRVFAVLPANVTGVKVQALPAYKRGQDAALPLEVLAAKPTTDPRVVHIDVMQPNGQPRDAYCKDVILSGPKGSFSIPFALNDPPGAWQVRIIDVASGVMTEAKLNLQ